MSYFKVLGLEKEPFSTSPDPDFFYHSLSHLTALKRLEIALRLKRGMSLIIGDVGSGKTTLWRTLIQQFAAEPDVIFHVMLDPGFKSESQFMSSLCRTFGMEAELFEAGSRSLREPLEKYLFRTAAEEEKTVVLIIDEGQKLEPENIEILRTLLNYETNEYKLLQLVILAQMEFAPMIRGMRNFSDRVSLTYTLNPLDENETGEMIEFRLRQAGYRRRYALFSREAVKLIHATTGGYPRKIALLCHEALKSAIMRDLDLIDEDTIRDVHGQTLRETHERLKPA
jgi:general secretion pathway protein A